MHKTLLDAAEPKPAWLLTTTLKFSALHQAIDWLLKILLLPILISVMVPFAPKMPAPGLDASWALALNQAVAQHLAFGKEIIFTLGPYSSIYTKAYHPTTDWMMMGGSLYLAFSYWLSLLLLIKKSKWRWSIGLGISLLGLLYARDSLFLSYPLLAGLACFKSFDTPKVHWQILLIFAPLGLLPLIKGSMLISCLFTSLLCTLFFLYYKKKLLGFMSLVVPIISLLLFWLGSGQSLANLPAYLLSSVELAAHFTEAMASNGDVNEIIAYSIASVLLLLSVLLQKGMPFAKRLFCCSVFGIFLFLSFKTGFTRHYGHAYIPATSILIAALLLPYLFNSWSLIPVLAISLSTAVYIDSHYTKISIASNVLSTYTSACHGFKNRLHHKNWLKDNFDLSLHFLQEQMPFPKIHGSTDMYSYNQSVLIATKIPWSPRPIFQSYSVFTAAQAKVNKNHLLSLRRPDNIIFKIEPIDGRVPSLEDGASWPILLNNYQAKQIKNDYLLLHIKNTNHSTSDPTKILKSAMHTLGERVLVPEVEHPLFIEIDLKPTLWGRITPIFFKPTPLQITFTLNNGIKKTYRLIASMARSGFLLSPLIENTQEFKALYQKGSLLDAKKIKSFSITSCDNTSRQWHKEYNIRFKLSA